MQINVTTGNDAVIIKLQGRFDFNSHRNFRASIDTVLSNPQQRKIIRVDLGAVDYLDSSALGMLLILRDKAQAIGGTVELINCHGNVAQILDVANFKALFSIA